MDMRPILVIAGLLAAGTVLAQAYRWVDADGVVHFSDRPQPGAEQIQLPEANTTSVRQYASPDAGAADSNGDADEPVSYESFAIAAPGAEETLWNIEGLLDVSLSLSPALQPGHQVRVYFNGEPRMVTGLSFQIEEVWRGVHNLQAEILDESGQLVVRSQANRFYVQQNTVGF